ncbi:MAG TPA: A/G-specific adenine glycosylase, partial [Candidatus Limnocylindrales bacterium]
FVAAFPTVDALAAASLDAVLRAWAGLGYNRRAVHLHRAARAIVAEHAGRVPSDPSRLEALPGVGPYTARAVAAIAFDQPVGAVDTNVRRVLSRTAGVDPADRAAVQALADALVPPDRAADWTAALMDVGTRHCRPMPVCDGCPVSPWCATRSARAAAPAGGPTGRARRPSPPFESTSRWLRGRIVSFLCAAPPGAWVRLDRPIGTHPPEAVAVALATLARDGLVELDPDDAAQARLATG